MIISEIGNFCASSVKIEDFVVIFNFVILAFFFKFNRDFIRKVV